MSLLDCFWFLLTTYNASLRLKSWFIKEQSLLGSGLAMDQNLGL